MTQKVVSFNEIVIFQNKKRGSFMRTYLRSLRVKIIYFKLKVTVCVNKGSLKCCNEFLLFKLLNERNSNNNNNINICIFENLFVCLILFLYIFLIFVLSTGRPISP